MLCKYGEHKYDILGEFLILFYSSFLHFKGVFNKAIIIIIISIYHTFK